MFKIKKLFKQISTILILIPSFFLLQTSVIGFIYINANSSLISSDSLSINGLILYLPFDEGSGTGVFDQSESGNDGVIYGASWTSDGISGSALKFDGEDDYVETKAADLNTGRMSVSVWANYDYAPPSTGGWTDAIISQDGETRVFQLSTFQGRIYWHRMGLAADASATDLIEANRWYHIAATFDGSTHRLYIDSTLNDQLPGSLEFNDTIPINVGRVNWNDFFFHGKIDEVRVYNRALSESEVQTLYNNIMKPTPTTPVTTDTTNNADSSLTTPIMLDSPGYEIFFGILTMVVITFLITQKRDVD